MPRIDRYVAIELAPGDKAEAREEFPPAPGVMLVERRIDGAGAVRVFYLCPCGCGDTTTLYIDPTRSYHPSWGLSIDAEGRPTLDPSVHCLEGCKSHYFIRDGVVQWV